MKKISTVFDYIISSFFVFLVMLVLFGSIFSGVFPLLISVFCTLLFSFLFFKIRGDVFLKKTLKSENLKRLKIIETSLLYMANSECLAFFKDFFKKIFSLDFSIDKDFLKSEETYVHLCFDTLEIGFFELLKASKLAREQGAKHLVVPCLKCSCDHKFLLSMFETVSVFTSQNLYEKMVEFDFFPTMIEEDILPKKNFKTVFSAFSNRKNARGFGVLGIVMFFFALISPFYTYYLIFSCTLLLLSAFLLLFKKK